MTTFFSNDPLKVGTLLSSGSKVDCLYDSEGNPGAYYQLIRFNTEDVDPTRVYISSASDSAGDVVFTTSTNHRFTSGWPITIYSGSYAGTYKLVEATPGTNTFKIATYANWMSAGANVQRVAGYAATAASYCGMFGTGDYPAFTRGSLGNFSVLNISCYQNVIISSTNSVDLPVSFPNMSAWLAEEDRLTFNEWREISKLKGSGFHMITNWEFCAALLMAYAYRGKVQTNLLRGNTEYGRSHVTGYWHETGRRMYTDTMGVQSVGNPGEGDQVLSGTGPATWRHTNNVFGISDLVGNMNDIVDGIYIYKGQIYINQYNNHINNNDDKLDHSDWLATGVYFDASADGDDDGNLDVIGAPILRYKSTFTTPAKSTYKLNNWTDDDTTLPTPDDDIATDLVRGQCAALTYDITTVGSKYTDAPLATQQILLKSLIDLSWLDSSVVTDGYVAVKNNGTRSLLRGGHFGPAVLSGGSLVYPNMFTYSFSYGKETPFAAATARTSFS